MSIKLSEDKINEIIRLKEKGYSYVNIAKVIGCSNVTVKNWICRFDIKTTKYNKKLSQINDNEIIQRYEKGESSRKIGKYAGCSHQEILKILKNNNVNIHNRYIDFAISKKIIKEYKDGDNTYYIADKYNFTPSAVRKLLIKHGVILRNNLLTKQQKNNIENLYQRGFSCIQIGEKLNCSDVQVSKILKLNNVTIRKCVGKDHHNWQGGITDINSIIRQCLHYKEWYSDNFRRTDYRDEITNVGGKLNVHHVYPLRIILKSSLMKHVCLPDEYKNTAIMNDERFYDLNNGLVLKSENHKLIEQNPRNCYPWWRIWKHFPEFTIKKSGFSEDQFLIFDNNGQVDPQNSIIVKSNKDEVKQTIRYEHYLGTVPPSQLILTAKLNDIITGIATFGRPNRHMKKDTWELTRLCVPHYVVRPFTIQFLHMCIDYIRKNYKNILNILSYSDTSVGHDGAVYRMSGFKNYGYTKPSYAYLDLNTYELKHKSFCRRIKDINKTERELAKERNLIKIPLASKKRWNYGV